MAPSLDPSFDASVDPVKRPTVTIAGQVLELKFRLSDVARLNKEHQIDLFVPTEIKGFPAMERLSHIIAAGVAHTGAGITFEQVLDSIEVPEIPIYLLAVAEAQKKASLSAINASKALARMAQEAMDSLKVTAATPIQ
jgi:hypothetical protein